MHKRLARQSLVTGRPVLTAAWRNLVLVNFPASPDLLSPYVPPGCELDWFEGQTYLSVVGFAFLDARLWGLAVPGYRRFAEVNLRFYVRRNVGGQMRRGVVFIREIAPKRGLAVAARLLYQENYLVRPMPEPPAVNGLAPTENSAIRYEWREGRRWSRVGARVGGSFAHPRPGSLEEFIIEHYWGYTKARDDRCLEYRVVHPPWRVAAAGDVCWQCDAERTYGRAFAGFLNRPPSSAMIADGSDVAVFRGRRLYEDDSAERF